MRDVELHDPHAAVEVLARRARPGHAVATGAVAERDVVGAAVSRVERVLHDPVELGAISRDREALHATVLAPGAELPRQQLLQRGLVRATVGAAERRGRGRRIDVEYACVCGHDALLHHALGREARDRRAVLVGHPVAAVARIDGDALGIHAVRIGGQVLREGGVAGHEPGAVINPGGDDVAETGDQLGVARNEAAAGSTERVRAGNPDLEAANDRQTTVRIGLQLHDRGREARGREGAAARRGIGLAVRAAVRDGDEAPVPGAWHDLQGGDAALTDATGHADDRARRSQRRRRQHERAVKRVATTLGRYRQRRCMRACREGQRSGRGAERESKSRHAEHPARLTAHRR